MIQRTDYRKTSESSLRLQRRYTRSHEKSTPSTYIVFDCKNDPTLMPGSLTPQNLARAFFQKVFQAQIVCRSNHDLFFILFAKQAPDLQQLQRKWTRLPIAPATQLNRLTLRTTQDLLLYCSVRSFSCQEEKSQTNLVPCEEISQQRKGVSSEQSAGSEPDNTMKNIPGKLFSSPELSVALWCGHQPFVSPLRQ